MQPSVVRALRPFALAAILVTIQACAAAPRAPVTPTTGDAVLQEMRQRYEGRWFRALAFEQQVEQTPLDGGAVRRGASRAALAVPGRLRIETDSTGRNGRLFARDSQYIVVADRVRRAVAGHDVRLVLGFDVHAQPPARTAEILRGLGFPAGPVREATWQERPVLVVGGGPDDLRTAQYWVDRERMVVVRLLQPAPGAPNRTLEIRFNGYRPLGGGWLPGEIEELVDGRRTLVERYADVRVDPALGEATFDPRRWAAGRLGRR